MSDTDTPEGPAVFKIAEPRMAWLQARVKRLAKRAERLGCSPISLTVLRREVHKTLSGDVKIWLYVTVAGDAPVIPGYVFLATIQHLGEAGNVIRRAPDVPASALKRYRTARSSCDHCRVDRRRNDTYIVFRESDRLTYQVGRTCLKDFMGHADPERYARAAELFFEIVATVEELDDDWGAGFTEGKRYVSLAAYLGWVAMLIRLYGWVSKGAAASDPNSAESTSISAITCLFPPSNPAHNPFHGLHPRAADHRAALASIGWARAIDPETDSDYLHNLRVVCMGEALPERCFGIAASAVSTYQREIARAEQRELDQVAGGSSEHLALVGDRLDLVVKVTGIKVINGWSEWAQDYTDRWIHKLTTRDNDRAVWFCGDVDRKLEQGRWYALRATVRDHKEFQGVLETTITRVSDARQLPSGFDALAEPLGRVVGDLDEKVHLYLEVVEQVGPEGKAPKRLVCRNGDGGTLVAFNTSTAPKWAVGSKVRVSGTVKATTLVAGARVMEHLTELGRPRVKASS